MYKTLVASALLAVALAAAPSAFAAPTAQQQRMADCSHQNKGKTGQAYKDAQQACLSGKSAPAAAATTPQARMKACNAEAGTKKLAGDAHKTFMSSCLKKS
jgi:hypothetical protein